MSTHARARARIHTHVDAQANLFKQSLAHRENVISDVFPRLVCAVQRNDRVDVVIYVP